MWTMPVGHVAVIPSSTRGAPTLTICWLIGCPDLAAHYAKLEAQALNGGPGTVPAGNRADDDDDFEEMPTPVAETAGKAPAGTESEDETEDAGPSRAGGEGADVMVMGESSLVSRVQSLDAELSDQSVACRCHSRK
jgi:hypothetical protein